ncbi:hypothetical protein ACTZRH_23390, partial [Klebsiella pneumoniae]
MSHYLQINGQRLIDSLYALGEHGAVERRGGVETVKNTKKKKKKGNKPKNVGRATGFYVLPPPMPHDFSLPL